MWKSNNSIKCPVCKTFIGWLIPDKAASFPCIECQWIFNFDAKGKEKPPTKLNPRKPETCDCGGCKYRDEQDALKHIRKL